MSTDLHLIGYRYNIAAAVFFVRQISHLFHHMLRIPSRSRIASLRSPRTSIISNDASILNVRVEISRSSYSNHRAGVSRPLPGSSSSPNIDTVPSIMIAWGLVMTLMCLVNSFQSLVMCVNYICISVRAQ